MRVYRGMWSVGLVLGLAGCAGTKPGLVGTEPARGPIQTRILAWRAGSSTTAKPTTTTVAANNSDGSAAVPDSLQAATAAAAAPVPKIDPKTVAPASASTSPLGRLFPSLNRAQVTPKAKVENDLVRPAGRDLWAESAREGLRSEPNAGEEARLAATAGNNDGTTVLPVSMEVGTSHTTVRPRVVPPPNRNPAKPRVAVAPVEEAKTDGGPTGVIPAAITPENAIAPEPASSPVIVVADTSPTPPPADATEPILPELVENPNTPATPSPTTDPAAALAGVETARTAVLAAPLPESETLTDPTLVSGLDTPPAPDRPAAPVTRSAPPNPNAAADDLAPAKPVAPPNPNAATPAPTPTPAPAPAPAPTKPDAAAADDTKPGPAAIPAADKPVDPGKEKPADDAKADTAKEQPDAPPVALPPTPAVPVVTPSPVSQSDVIADPFPAALSALRPTSAPPPRPRRGRHPPIPRPPRRAKSPPPRRLPRHLPRRARRHRRPLPSSPVPPRKEA